MYFVITVEIEFIFSIYSYSDTLESYLFLKTYLISNLSTEFSLYLSIVPILVQTIIMSCLGYSNSFLPGLLSSNLFSTQKPK